MKRFRLFAGSMLPTLALVSAATAYSINPPGYPWTCSVNSASAATPKRVHLKLKFIDPNGKPLRSKQVTHVQVRADGGGSYSPMYSDKNAIGKMTIYTESAYNSLFVVDGLGFAELQLYRSKATVYASPIIIKLQSGAYFVGKITNASGKPLGGVMVFPERQYVANDKWQIWNKLFGNFKGGLTTADAMAAVSTDGTGYYKIGPLPAGKYSFAVCFPQKGMPVAKTVNLDVSGKSSSKLDIILPMKMPVCTLRGKLIRQTDRAVIQNASIDVILSPVHTGAKETGQELRIPRKAKTDSAGNFQLYPVLPGEFRMTVLWDHHPAEKVVKVNAADAQVNVLLTKEDLTSLGTGKFYGYSGPL